MKHLKSLLLTCFVTSMLVGCERSGAPADLVVSTNAPTTSSTSHPSSSTSSSAPAPAPGKPAAVVFAASPDLPTALNSPWDDRLQAFLLGKAPSFWCPAFGEVTGKDEFEIKDAKDAATKKCRDELDRLATLSKSCPLLVKAMADIRPYDFDRGELPLALRPEGDMLTSDDGRIWWNREFLLSWGLKPDRLKPHRFWGKNMQCRGGWIDNMTGQSNTSVDLKLGRDDVRALKDAIGKVHEDTSRVLIEVAVLLDGKTGTAPLACDAAVPRTPTGRVLAWRLFVSKCSSITDCVDTPIRGWESVGTWSDPPSSCAEMKKLLSEPKDSTAITSGKKGPPNLR